MANLKEIRGRIKTVKSTQQVTKAMKMVAAAKLRKAQDRMIQLRPYAGKLREIIGLLGPNCAGKTTTMRMITGNLAPSKGSVTISYAMLQGGAWLQSNASAG